MRQESGWFPVSYRTLVCKVHCLLIFFFKFYLNWICQSLLSVCVEWSMVKDLIQVICPLSLLLYSLIAA
jgi:hypothetical protein